MSVVSVHMCEEGRLTWEEAHVADVAEVVGVGHLFFAWLRVDD